jgi:monoamine oxidase
MEARDHTGVEHTSAAIFGFISWPLEQRRNNPEDLRQAILDQLSECFGKAALHHTKLVVEDWAANPRIVTDMDVSRSAAHPDVGPAVLRQPHLDGRVWFAVSEVSELSPGQIEGALAIGESVAAEVFGTSA